MTQNVPSNPAQVAFDAIWHAFLTNPVPFVLTGLLLVGSGVLKAFMPRIKGALGEWMVRRTLDRLGYEHVHDLYLTSWDGTTQVDHVAKVGHALVVIETKNYAGWITGGEHSAQWTQTLAGGNVKNRFQNPLRQNHGHARAVQTACPGVPVHGVVVFTGGSHFPKGMPEGVVSVSGLGAFLKPIAQRPAAGDVSFAWRKLTRLKSAVRREDRVDQRRTVERAKARERR